jgi:uncharacterized membrane protein YedE/YeeE
MGNVNDWVGTLGGTILGLELIVLLLVLVAINAGLAFLLMLALRKMGWVHDKIVFAQGLQAKFLDRGTRIAAMPVIVSTSVWRGFKAGLHRATHWPARGKVRPMPVIPAPNPERVAPGASRVA